MKFVLDNKVKHIIMELLGGGDDACYDLNTTGLKHSNVK
jgi:hypothetical protein